MINYTKIDFPEEKIFKLYQLVSSLNKLCIKGSFLIDEKQKIVIYSYCLDKNFKYLNFHIPFQLIKNSLCEIENLSKKMSLGMHQILYTESQIEYIEECLLSETHGNA